MTPESDLLTTRLPGVVPPLFRLGLAATYRPGERAVRAALDQGVNYLFGFAADTQMNRVVRGMSAGQREKVVLATGGYNWLLWHPPLKKSLENALRRWKTDYIDVFHYLGLMKPRDFPTRIQDELAALRSTGAIRSIAVSCHDRKFAGSLAANGVVDSLMIRYNAAHPGAENDIFPQVAARKTGVIGYTATRWAALLRRPRGWTEPLATAGQCYRFVISNPHVNVVLTAPRSEREVLQNISEIRRGALPDDEMTFMRHFGAHVHDRAGWFMGQ